MANEMSDGHPRRRWVRFGSGAEPAWKAAAGGKVKRFTPAEVETLRAERKAQRRRLIAARAAKVRP